MQNVPRVLYRRQYVIVASLELRKWHILRYPITTAQTKNDGIRQCVSWPNGEDRELGVMFDPSPYLNNNVLGRNDQYFDLCPGHAQMLNSVYVRLAISDHNEIVCRNCLMICLIETPREKLDRKKFSLLYSPLRYLRNLYSPRKVMVMWVLKSWPCSGSQTHNTLHKLLLFHLNLI